jgi:hypothetical protein
MNVKLFISLLCIGFAALLGSTALVATLPSSSTTHTHRTEAGAIPSGWFTGSPRSTSTTSARPSESPRAETKPTSEATTTTAPPSIPPTTAFVLVTITYQVKKGDTVPSIQNWFDQRGYSSQFAANLQVIDDNQDLLVPGALVSISNGVMTIHSPI